MTVHRTPGPWHVDDDGCVRTRDGRDVVTAFDHRVIATDADARLIAAAPDLLALAEAVIATAPVGSAVWGRLLRMAHVAHALATGEASRERT
jgi:hypothetical protein